MHSFKRAQITLVTKSLFAYCNLIGFAEVILRFYTC